MEPTVRACQQGTTNSLEFRADFGWGSEARLRSIMENKSSVMSDKGNCIGGERKRKGQKQVESPMLKKQAVEPLLRDNPDRFCMFPIKYPEVWEMYKKAEASFWTGRALDLNLEVESPGAFCLFQSAGHSNGILSSKAVLEI